MPKPSPSICFNEIDPFLGQWLKNLWPKCIVNIGDIKETNAKALKGYKRVHLFAGIGGWEYALMIAGWPRNRPVWSGSCPCQPFSCAGKQKGTDDERHLWPEFCRLIKQCRPPTVFGEQVASKLGRAWLARVRDDLEGLGYAVGAADLPTACLGSPHIRQRLWWVARLANPNMQQQNDTVKRAASKVKGRQNNKKYRKWGASEKLERESTSFSGKAVNGLRAWDNYQLVSCLDGNFRRIEPGVFPLAHGIPSRVGRLHAYGNSNCPQVAAIFIRSFLQAESQAFCQFAESVSP